MKLKIAYLTPLLLCGCSSSIEDVKNNALDHWPLIALGVWIYVLERRINGVPDEIYALRREVNNLKNSNARLTDEFAICKIDNENMKRFLDMP